MHYSSHVVTVEHMNTYRIFAILSQAATYNELDGFGDYKNYTTRRVCEVGAHNEAEAMKIANCKDRFDITFYAELMA